MNYELAKQLKEVGFPQVQPNCSHTDFNDCTNPTLSELIRACGDDFLLLERDEIDDKTVWFVYERFDRENWKIRGNTPEDAVAKFWLEYKAPRRGK